MFNENSGLVQIWVRLIQSGTQNLDNVPNLSNLQDIVFSIVSKQEENNDQEKKAEAFDYIVKCGNENE